MSKAHGQSPWHTEFKVNHYQTARRVGALPKVNIAVRLWRVMYRCAASRATKRAAAMAELLTARRS